MKPCSTLSYMYFGFDSGEKNFVYTFLFDLPTWNPRGGISLLQGGSHACSALGFVGHCNRSPLPLVAALVRFVFSGQ